MKKVFYIVVLLLFVSCNTNKQFIHAKKVNYKVSNDLKKSWYHKDILKDSIPGISLERAYQELIKNKKGKEVVVAVIDTQMDINHEDLKQAIWLNKDEIPNNGIDDDNNGYIDDIHGWNFISTQDGQTIMRSRFECARIINKYESKFNSDSLLFLKNEPVKYKIYKKAKHISNEKFINNESTKNFYKEFLLKRTNAENALKEYFPNKEFTVKKIKSINTNDTKLKEHIKNLTLCLENGFTIEALNYQIDVIAKRYLDVYLNKNYNEREPLNENPNDINDNHYGSNKITSNKKGDPLMNHSTYVSGVLVKAKNIRIMPVVVSNFGDEFDKDIALAIYYAVDNGAKIINMSSTKELSLNEKWVKDALIYASKRDVLFITSAGNNFLDLDKNSYYPNDIDKSGEEIMDNFICIGASTKNADKHLMLNFTNFGNKNVDIFAPGDDIYTTKQNNKYTYKSGTSMATPMVSVVATLIKSYFPKLTASQVKEIILASGTSYKFDVENEDIYGKIELVPFNSLSKSGKIVNAYNALLLAKHYKQWKKGKWKM